MESRIRTLRFVGIAEGISFLVLLFLAMPLKYYLNLPLGVKVVGWIHGILFIAYVVVVLANISAMRWNFFRVIIALVAALLPFGTFVLDRELKKRLHELAKLKPAKA